jgi:hypothetical protein
MGYDLPTGKETCRFKTYENIPNGGGGTAIVFEFDWTRRSFDDTNTTSSSGGNGDLLMGILPTPHIIKKLETSGAIRSNFEALQLTQMVLLLYSLFGTVIFLTGYCRKELYLKLTEKRG